LSKNTRLCRSHSASVSCEPEQIPKQHVDSPNYGESQFSKRPGACSRDSDFLLGGHDTTGYTLASTLVLLAKHKRVAERLRDELKRSPSDEWQNVEYMKCVIKESMRLLPVAAAVVARSTGRDFFHHGEIIPKGAICLLPMYVIMRNENVFEKADEFLPERWLDATPAMNDSFVPFAAGNRNCLGQALAKAEIESVLPLFVTHFDFVLESEGELDFFVTLRYVGARLTVKRISN